MTAYHDEHTHYVMKTGFPLADLCSTAVKELHRNPLKVYISNWINKKDKPINIELGLPNSIPSDCEPKIVFSIYNS